MMQTILIIDDVETVWGIGFRLKNRILMISGRFS